MSDPMFVGLVSDVDQTRHGPKVRVTALRGELADGDEVVIVHPDGTSARARFTDVGRHPITPQTYEGKAFRQEGMPEHAYRTGDLLLAPDGEPVEIDPASPLAAEIATAREAGLSTRPHVPDAVVALHILRATETAVTSAKGSVTMMGAFSRLGEVYDLYGLTEQGDRARLVASAAVEGYPPRPTMQVLATAGAGVLNLATTFKDSMTVRAIGMSMEQGDQFVKSFNKSMAVTGSGIRIPLQETGRAVARGWCRKCGEVRTLTTKLRCEVCGKEPEDYRVVVPADAAAADEELRAANAGRKRGLFGR